MQPTDGTGAMSDMAPLQIAGTYRRRVGASLARIWENVFDWEHLAHLHDGSFRQCVLVDSGPWGWRVALTVHGAKPQTIALHADRGANRYVSTTLDGKARGTEIRVSLAPIAEHLVDVVVEFHLPEQRPDRLAAFGKSYAAAYATLWDEDEAMMQARERALTRRTQPDRTSPPLDLGDEQAVRAQLPMNFELGGVAFRLVELGGAWIAHAVLCPHWLGPLDDAPIVDGAVRCPWHGYVFDVASGSCQSQPALKLVAPPTIRMVGGRVIAEWS